MGVLVEDMLLLARLDQQRPIERRPVDLLTLAADAVQDARMIAPGRKITLTVGRGAAFLVLGDEARLRQVIANLMNNALSHTPDGTPIDGPDPRPRPGRQLPVPSVDARGRRPWPRPEPGPGRAGLRAVLPGRPGPGAQDRRRRARPGDRRRAGTPRTTAPSGVDTAPGSGAMFWITLPLAAEAA